MPNTATAGMLAHLAGTQLTLAYCVKVTRRDGTVKGFTSLDADLTIDSVTYEANAAVSASAISASLGSGVDNLEFSGLLNSDQLTDTDIRAGLWDSAAVEVFVVNYKDLTHGKVVLLTGNFGEFEFAEGRYRVEVRSLFQVLQQQVGELYSPTCRVRRFLDVRCNPDGTLDPANHIFTRTVAAASGDNYLLLFGDSHGSGFFTHGTVEFRSGLNKGIEREIKKHRHLSGPVQAELTLHEPFPFAVAVGDTAVLTQGCDRRFISCVTLFSNGKNFQGEPQLPGNDKILRRGRKS